MRMLRKGYPEERSEKPARATLRLDLITQQKKKNVKSVRRTIDVAQCPGQVGQGEISVEKNEMVLDYNLQHCLEQCMNVFTACITCQRLSASFFQHSPDPKVTDL